MKSIHAVIALMLLFLAGPANAGLIGDSVTIQLVGDTFDLPAETVTVGAGEEGAIGPSDYLDL